MKKMILLLVAVVLLSGCAAAETFETVADEMATPVMGKEKHVVLDLPDSAASPVVNTADGGRFFMCDGYDLFVQTMAAGDLSRTVKQVCGYALDKMTILESCKDGIDRYEWVWTSAGEGGDQIGRAVVLSDGNYHYCISVMADAETAGTLDDEWTKVLGDIRLA